MRLHNTLDFYDAIVATSKHFRLREVLVEKDYWLTYVLWNLSRSQHKKTVVFKGGTSLSKAYKIIRRFSEDIDLAIICLDETGAEMSGNKIKSVIKAVESSIAVPPLEIDDSYYLTSKGSKFRKTAHTYPRKVEGDFGQASDRLVLEINSFANPHPFQAMEVSSYIAQYFDFYDKSLISEYQIEPFMINVLDLNRTFAEKVMGLVRAGYQSDNSLNELKQKIRHVYDVSKLLEQPGIQNLINNKNEFFALIKKVQLDDQKNQEFQGEWSTRNLNEAEIFRDPKATLQRLQSTFRGDFKALLFDADELPKIVDMVDQFEKLGAVLRMFDEGPTEKREL